jgi:hypothetical protein
MLTGETPSPREVENVAQRVLGLERTALRRAWGVLYAVAAVELTVGGIFPVVIHELGFSAWYTTPIGIVVSAAGSLVGLATVLWIFRRVYALRFVRNVITGSLFAKAIRPLPALAIFAIAYAALIAIIEFYPSDFYTILFGSGVAGIPWFYYALKVTFPDGLPREGIVTLAASGVESIGILITYESAFATDALLYLLLWGGMVLVLSLAFVSSRLVKAPAGPGVDEN